MQQASRLSESALLHWIDEGDGPTGVDTGCHYMAADFGFLPIPGVGEVVFYGRPSGPGGWSPIAPASRLSSTSVTSPAVVGAR